MEVVSINISEKKGVVKIPVESCNLIKDHGIEHDAHAGNWHRQVSLLASEDFKLMKNVDLSYGAFAENITTKGIEVHKLLVGQQFLIDQVLLEVTQIGKECHQKCAIYYKSGDCVMPKRGIFAKVLVSGKIKIGSNIKLL